MSRLVRKLLTDTGPALAALLIVLMLLPVGARAQEAEGAWTGPEIMQEVFRRHEQFPYVYEEQTMVLMDEARNRDVRQCRRLTRAEPDGTVKFLLIFDAPAEIRGVALLAVRDPNGNTRSGVYLPAFGPEFKRPVGDGRRGHFLGTDFSIEDLTPELPNDFKYVRRLDRSLDGVEYFVVEARPKDEAVQRTTDYGLRRHLIQKDTLVITQTDFFDTRQRFVKRLTNYDLTPVRGESWRANMTVVYDEREKHRTLLKIDRRVYSRDYVPAEFFEPEYLLGNHHVVGAAVGQQVEEDAEKLLEQKFKEDASDS
ncbi:MAG: hypothetical protein DRQ37_02170 [Gammaproteobacteria bacterium]|nr:MAG: hypothetical protein DRQ37_02170 [Gammaproteobacteria bacterium]